ncbi:MAG: glycosyltransferase [Ignavibacteria bacterium]|nr:glycosyltransferase [Ignavibacteria bacterium]
MDLSIIIVNYNVKEFLQNLLHSIDKASQNLSSEIIVVDNASDDGSIELLKSKFPSVKLIENKTNLGFGKANNQALNIAQGKYLLLINPDAIVSEDTFTKMIEFLEEQKDAGLAGCKILNPDGSLQLACRRSFPGPWTSFCKVTGLSNFFPNSKMFARYNLTYLDENQTYEVDAISGSFMMLKREVYEKIGGFDEKFFMYGEDLDLCYRIQKVGYKVFYVHTTQVIHYKGESTKRSSIDETKVFYTAMHLFVKKHFSSSFLVELILRSAIGLRKLFAFLGKRKLIFFSIILDFIFFNFSLFLAEKIYVGMTTWVGFNKPDYLVVYTVPAVIHIITASLMGVYKREVFSVLRNFGAVILSFIILTSITFFFKEYAYSRAVVVLSYFLLFFILTTWRVVLKLFFKVGVKLDGTINKRTLVVGVDDRAVEIAKKLKAQKKDIYNFIGFIGKSHSDVGKKLEGFEVAGSLLNFGKIIKEKQINEVIFSSRDLPYGEMMSIVSASSYNSVEFKISGDDLSYAVGKTSVSMLDDIPLIELHYNISNPRLKTIKYLFDFLLAVPVLFLIYPFIYFSSKLSKKKSPFKNFILGIPSVLIGKRSFVGPKSTNSNQGMFIGKTGLTGFWYIEDEEYEANDKLDIYYAKNQNVWLDMEILGKTLNKMWSKKDK